MARTEAQKLQDWLVKNNLSAEEAKKLLKPLRDQRSRQYATVSHDFSGTRIRIGILGDTHLGNKWTDKKFLGEVMQQFKRDKVEAVYHTGDLTDGPWQRHKNVLEQYAHGFQAQVDDFVDDFPNIGKPIFIIDGNHDGWYRQGEGGLIGRAIELQRDDVTYLGHDEALIKMGKLEMMMSHPNDATSYAYSYKAQKMIESMVKMQERIPDIILQGHYHKIFSMNAAGTTYLCTGTTCRQTPWMRGKKIAADMGAMILDLYRNSRGELIKLTQTILPYRGNTHRQAIK